MAKRSEKVNVKDEGRQEEQIETRKVFYRTCNPMSAYVKSNITDFLYFL